MTTTTKWLPVPDTLTVPSYRRRGIRRTCRTSNGRNPIVTRDDMVIYKRSVSEWRRVQ